LLLQMLLWLCVWLRSLRTAEQVRSKLLRPSDGWLMRLRHRFGCSTTRQPFGDAADRLSNTAWARDAALERLTLWRDRPARSMRASESAVELSWTPDVLGSWRGAVQVPASRLVTAAPVLRAPRASAGVCLRRVNANERSRCCGTIVRLLTGRIRLELVRADDSVARRPSGRPPRRLISFNFNLPREVLLPRAAPNQS
jgi:hypothetical protein